MGVRLSDTNPEIRMATTMVTENSCRSLPTMIIDKPRIPDAESIAEANAPLAAALDADYAALGARLARDGIEIDRITAAAVRP